MKTKICFKCGKRKSLNSFYGHSQMKDGKLNKCKECNKIDVQLNYRKNIHHYIEYENKRKNDPDRKKKRLENQRMARKRNPLLTKIRYLVTNAIRDGKIIKGVCSVCGNPKVEGHHEDYSKPFDIIWLCKKHHLEIHNKEYHR